MKTYAQTKKKKNLDWNKWLDDAIAGKVVNLGQAENLASDWVTCACGSQCAILERNFGGEPVDGKLSSLGMKFMNCIDDGAFKEAKEILLKIEDRSRVLIAEKEKEAIGILKQLGYTFS